MTQQKRSTVITLLENGVSQHEIHRKTGIDRKTIRKVARGMVETPANSSMATGSGGVGEQIPPPWPPALTAGGSPVVRSACEPHRGWIEAQIRLGRNAMAIYQDLVDQHGFASRYNSVKRFCRSLRQTEPAQFDRLEFLPGEEAQVDYGEGALSASPNFMFPTLLACGKNLFGNRIESKEACLPPALVSAAPTSVTRYAAKAD